MHTGVTNTSQTLAIRMQSRAGYQTRHGRTTSVSYTVTEPRFVSLLQQFMDESLTALSTWSNRRFVSNLMRLVVAIAVENSHTVYTQYQSLKGYHVDMKRQ